MKLTTLLKSWLFFYIIISSIHADDYRKIVRQTALLLYPTDDIARLEYVKSEDRSGKLFNSFHSNQELNNELMRELRAFCIWKHPYSMQHRVDEMQAQLASYRHLREESWAAGLPTAVKGKILNIAELMSGTDYYMRYQWAFAEAQAFKRLSRYTGQKTEAQKKWPNSYQSQLIEIIGIKPGTPLPQKTPKPTMNLRVIHK